jgi:hypothetical protein
MPGCNGALVLAAVLAFCFSLQLSWNTKPHELEHAASKPSGIEEDSLLLLHLGPEFVAISGCTSGSPEFVVQWDLLDEGEEEDDTLLEQEAFDRCAARVLFLRVCKMTTIHPVFCKMTSIHPHNHHSIGTFRQ